MTQRVTAPEVRAMFGRTVRAAQSVGFDTHSWYLMPGSRVNGRAWRLFSRPGGGTALGGLDRGFLGMTAREARDRLETLAVAWEAVADHLDRIGQDLIRRVDATEILGDLGESNSG